MIYLLYGALGAIWTLAVFAGGAAVGWKGHILAAGRKKAAEERQSFDDEQRSFEEMLRYNMDTAYGMADEGGETL